MKEALIIAIPIAIFLLGYFLMSGFDRFLGENRETIENESEKQEPSCVMLPDEMTEAEIVEEVKKFRKNHGKVRIVMYDGKEHGSREAVELDADKKQ